MKRLTLRTETVLQGQTGLRLHQVVEADALLAGGRVLQPREVLVLEVKTGTLHFNYLSKK